MPMPFQKIFQRPGLRRILMPFTFALLLLAFVIFALIGT